MMGKTETQSDKDQANMARVWIEPSYFVGFARGRICARLGRWKKREGGLATESGIRDQTRRKRRGRYGSETRQKVRGAANDMLTTNLQQPPVGHRPHCAAYKEDAERGVFPAHLKEERQLK